ncbi:hypothetical protein HOY80DRAFT_1052469 [Tuber brumale]|nr:hypothetical protein HOY80DRAFT_1052469 [Tuber brumale]
MGLIILAVARVVSPLGLSKEVAPSFTEPAVLKYLKDTSTFGQQWKNCPGATPGVKYFAHRARLYLPSKAYIDTSIPQKITEILKSGTSGHGNLISGPFDAQYRGDVYTTGVDATLRSVILNDSFVLVEGVTVDAAGGGSLWLEPVAQCVDSNLTVDFTIFSDQEIGNLHLIDYGGWVHLPPDMPNFNRVNAPLDPQLWQRIDRRAWKMNRTAAWFLYVT